MKTDQWVVLLCILLIVIHVAALISGLVTHRLSQYVVLLNMFSGSMILMYWIIKQLQISQHYFELREFVVLGLEVLVVCCAVYVVATKQWTHGLRILQYILFGVHLSALIFLMVFMLTFKMKRLI